VFSVDEYRAVSAPAGISAARAVCVKLYFLHIYPYKRKSDSFYAVGSLIRDSNYAPVVSSVVSSLMGSLPLSLK
jgi:hypothetical protein